MALKHDVSKNVRRLRLAQKMTQQQLAERTALDVRYVSRLENHPQNVRLDILERVAEGLGVLPSDLLGSKNATAKHSVVNKVENLANQIIALVHELP
jgi:transcriptional regulator with XRE-family HTH domain